jgi:SAM-dependent methyltransferase
VLQFSVQSDHLHLIVEADTARQLARGLQGLAVRCARAINRGAGRRGPVWSHRYHAHPLATPSQVRTGLIYVLLTSASTRRAHRLRRRPRLHRWRPGAEARPPGRAKIMKPVPYDPTIYRGSAAHYARGRAPYSRALATTLTDVLGLDGSGRLLDVGCGPGILALELAPLFEEVIGLDPDADMLAEGARRAAGQGTGNVRWVQALAEEIDELGLGTFRLVTFGQSFHWTDRERVAPMVYDLLEPGGAMAVIAHEREGRPEPAGPGQPPVPHDAIKAVLERHLGPRRRAGQGYASPPGERYADTLARIGFAPHVLHCPGRPDVVQDVEAVLSGYLSTSYAAPHLFGDGLEPFAAEVRALLAALSARGLFWEWPGDTVVWLARKGAATAPTAPRSGSRAP